MRVGWRVVPRGKPAATAADFIGGRWPSGTIDLPAWPTSREPNPPSVEISFWPRDDDIAEMNETLGVELLDRHGRVIWGSETWAPEILGRSVLWYWSKNHPNGVILTIHDAGHQCSIPGPNSGFSIVNKRERREYRQYWRWPGLFVDRPERPIVQCEVLRWRLSDGGARPLRASDFAGGRFPGGTLRYSSDATGGPEEDDTQPIRFKLRRGVSGRGRTVKITLETSRGVIAQSVQTLK